MRVSSDLPGHGAPGDPLGVFHVLYYGPTEDGPFRLVHGDTSVAALRLTPKGPDGETLLTYGNRSGPDFPRSPQL